MNESNMAEIITFLDTVSNRCPESNKSIPIHPKFEKVILREQDFQNEF